MNTLRAYMGADTLLTVWVRDEAGNVEFGEDTLTASIVPYARNRGHDMTIVCNTHEAAGKVTFTVSEAFATQNMQPGPYRVEIKNDESNAVVYGGLLEMV